MKKDRLIFSIPVLLLLLLTSCLTQKDIEFREVRNLRPAFSDETTTISFDLLLNNPNNWGLTVSKADIQLHLDGKIAGTSSVQKPVKLKAGCETLVPCSIECMNSDLVNLLPSGIEVLLGTKTMTARTSGTITVRKFIIRKKYPFELQQKVDNKFLKGLF